MPRWAEYFNAVRGLSVLVFRLVALSLGLEEGYFDWFVGSDNLYHEPSNTWYPVPYTTGAYVVNIGDMMERWTNNRYKSTRHRVTSPISNRDRYSIAFFNEGLLDQVIASIPTCVDEGEVPLHEPITVGAHLRKRDAGSY
ncbi:hypothetical protein BDV12DRAFT_200311 [Aspergillus spectabilis]